jgi:vacuolar-type H+-ATPase subunit H
VRGGRTAHENEGELVDEQSGVKAAASTATDRARELAHDASAHAGDLTGSVREHAGDVGQEMVQQGRRVIEDARGKAREEADAQSRQAVSALRQWSDRGRALAEGRTEDAGPLADYTRDLAGRVSDIADRMDQRGFDGVLDDVRSFARRRPGMFLLGAGVAGFAVGRLVRGAKDAPADPPPGPTRAAIAGREPEPYGQPVVTAGAVPPPSVAPSTTGVAVSAEGLAR